MKKSKQNKQPWYKEWWIWVIILIVVGNVIFLGFQIYRFQAKQNEEKTKISQNQTSLDNLLHNPEVLYLNELENQSNKWVTLFSDFYKTLQEKDNSEEWQNNLLQNLVELKLMVQEASYLEAPDNLQSVHEEYMTAVVHFNTMIDALPEALDNQDMDSVESCIEELELGIESLKKTRELVSSYQENKL